METSRVPPHDIEAEKAVLGAMMLEGEACGIAAELLRPDDFHRARHRLIFSEISRLWDCHEMPDVVLVSAGLAEDRHLEDIGGDDYLHELISSTPSAANVERYAKIVKEHSVRRKVITACAATLNQADSGSSVDALDSLHGRITELSMELYQSGPEPISTILVDAHKNFESAMKDYKTTHNVIRGIPSGLAAIDRMTGGFDPGDYVIIGASPSSGKTSLAITMMVKGFALGIPALFFSLEMSREQIGIRFLANKSGVAYDVIRQGTANTEEHTKVGMAMVDLGEAPCYIESRKQVGIKEMRAWARKFVREHGVKIIYLDYIQLMRMDEAQNRERQVAEASQSIKDIASELGITFVALSQLRKIGMPGRQKDRHGNLVQPPQPTLEDIRDSGSPVQDADTVILLHREIEDSANDPTTDGLLYKPDVIVILAKQRNGPTGKRMLHFDAPAMRFRD